MVSSRLYLEEHGTPARERLAQWMADIKGDDLLIPVTVVVPTQYAGLSLRRSLGAGGGLINVRFMVLARLAEYLGSPRLAERGKVPLSPLVELAAIRAIAREISGDGPLGEIAHHPRLHTSLRETFGELVRLSGEGLARLESQDLLRAQIVRWYRLSRERLGGYYDREELARAAAAAVEGGEASGALRDLGFIVFYLVQDLSPGEVALVMALGRQGRCAMILGLVGEEEIDAAARRVASRMEPVLGPASSAAPSPRGYGASHLVEASDAQEEVRWVVRHLAHRAEQGLPFHRMAVLYRQRDPYASLILGQLRLAGIPVAGPDPTPLRDTPAGKLLSSLLRVFESDFSRESVLQWMAESPVGMEPGGGLASGELARWEVISRKAGVIQCAGQWQERVGRYRAALARQLARVEEPEEALPAEAGELQNLMASADCLLGFLQGLASQSPPTGGSSWRSYAGWSGSLLQGYAQDPGQWPQEHQTSYDRVMALLDELAGLDAVAPGTDLAGFRWMLDDALEAPSGRAGLTGSGVFVAPVAAAQAMAFEAVYLVGMAEGAFPPRMPDDPMLPDHLREEVEGGDRLPLRRARRIEERRLFLAALAAGCERVLSYSKTDTAAQRGQHPSPWFLDETARLHGSPVGSADLPKLGSPAWLSVIQSSQQALEYSIELAAADLHDYDVASVARWRARGYPLERHFLALEDGPLGRALRMERGRRGVEFTVWDGRLSALAGQSRLLRLPVDGALSPTRLERWAVCPFRYFLGDVLGISALERPEELWTISSLDRGTLIHTILEQFVRAAMERGRLPGFGEPWGELHRKWLMEIAEKEFERAEAEGITGRRLLWEAVQEEIRQDLLGFLEEDGRHRAEQQLRPSGVEQRFGPDRSDSLPPVVVPLSSGLQLRFRGRIDRVDLHPSGSRVIVIDYKTGSASPYQEMKTDPLGGGRRLQLPVYALAARSAAGEGAEVEAHYWFVTARGGFERKAVSLAQVERRFLEVVETIAAGIQQGLFPANPGPPGRDGRPQNCQFCDFDRICLTDRELLWMRKRDNPELSPYLNLIGLEGGEEDKE